MSTIAHQEIRPQVGVEGIVTDEPIFPLSVEAYHDLIASGRLGEDDPVELIEGVLVFKMPKNKPHIYVLTTINAWIVPTLSAGWISLNQDPITLDDGEPEPDFSIVTRESIDRPQGHPRPTEVALVIEIADGSIKRDRGAKLRSYARGGVPIYWIVNLATRSNEVYTRPLPSANPPTYADRRDVTEAETIALPDVVGGATIRVGELLPLA